MTSAGESRGMTTFDTIANAYITAWNARDADRA